MCCSEGTLSRSSWRMKKPSFPRLQLSSIGVSGTNCGDSKSRRSNCTLLFYHAIACILSAFFRSTPIAVMKFFIVVRAKITCSEFRYQLLLFRGTTTMCCSGYLIHHFNTSWFWVVCHNEQSSKQFRSRVLHMVEPFSVSTQSTHSYTHFSSHRSSSWLKKALSSMAASFMLPRGQVKTIPRFISDHQIWYRICLMLLHFSLSCP